MQPRPNEIGDFVRYNADADRRLFFRCCEDLSPSEFEMDLGGSFRSVLNTFWHVYDAEYFWVDNLIRGTIPPLKTFGEPSPVTGIAPDLQLLRSRWPDLWKRMETDIANLTEEAWHQVVTCDLLDGSQLRLSRQQVAMHMVNHSTMHRGQILHMLRQLKRVPINIDLFGYYIALNSEHSQ